MAVDLSSLSVTGIRQRFLSQDAPISSQLLSRMQKDPRQGVRQIYATLKKRRDKEKGERRRIQTMLGFERILWKSGAEHVAGVDEVGVGPLAGPVVAAAVIFTPGTFISRVDDCKCVAPGVRAQLARIIRREALAVATGVAQIDEIDTLNIYQAGILAMQRAVENLPRRPDHLLIDAREIPALSIPQTPFTRGDGLSFSVAAASIVAKTCRDQIMVDLDHQYPHYGFAQHKGYSTTAHQEAIRRHGPCPVHRRSFTFIRELCGEYSDLFYVLKDKLSGMATFQQMRVFEDEFRAARHELSRREGRKIKLMLARRWRSVGFDSR